MEETLGRVWNDLIARTQGPMWFRLVLQPIVAIAFGVRAGRRIAQRLDQDSSERLDRSWLLRLGLHDIGKVAAIGLLLDGVVQWIVLGTIYPFEALLVVFLIVIVPYQIIRTVVARIL